MQKKRIKRNVKPSPSKLRARSTPTKRSRSIAANVPPLKVAKLNTNVGNLTSEQIDTISDELVDWFSQPRNIWLKDFALVKGTYWTRILELSERSDRLAVALKVVHDMQESKLFKLGLSRAVNPSVPIFALKNVAGWRDRVELTPGSVFDAETKRDPYKEIAEHFERLGIVFPQQLEQEASVGSREIGALGKVPQIPARLDPRSPRRKR